MMRMRDWVQLPSQWIESGGLRTMQWTKSNVSGSDNLAALMVLMPIAHIADDQGVSICTYDQLTHATGLSRAKVSKGLSVLTDHLGVIQRNPAKRSTFQLTRYGENGWAMLPAKKLYSGDKRILGFKDFKLRSMAELHALKLYYLFACRRSRDSNMAHLSYKTIEGYTHIDRSRIKAAISILINADLVHVERTQSLHDHGMVNSYRLTHLNPYRHFGTQGRNPDYALGKKT